MSHREDDLHLTSCSHCYIDKVLTEGEIQVLWRQIGWRKLTTDELQRSAATQIYVQWTIKKKEKKKRIYSKLLFAWKTYRNQMIENDVFRGHLQLWLQSTLFQLILPDKLRSSQNSWKMTQELKIILAGDHYKDAIKGTNVDFRDYLPFWKFYSPCRSNETF